MSSRNWLFSLLFFFFLLPVSAKELEISSIKLPAPPDSLNSVEQFDLELISPYSQVKKDSSFLVGIRIKIPEEWHSYWSFAGDFGQAPKIKWQKIKNVKIDSLPFPTPERKSFYVNKKQSYSFIYEKELLIPFKVFIDKSYTGNHIPLFLDLQWFVCKELCLSKENSLSLNLKLGDVFEINSKSKKVFDFWESFYPEELELKSQFEVKDKKLILEFSFEEEIKCMDVLPAGSMEFSTAKPVLLNQNPNSCVFQAEKLDSNLTKISGLMIYSRQGKKQSSLFQSDIYKGVGIFWFILLAFLGGLILNFMPCVLPIIFLKFYNTLELKHLPSRKILFLNLSYAVGVIASFLVLAFVIFISKQTGESLGWGFHLQSPLFVTFLSSLFFLMAFYLLNAISFPFPKVSLFFKDEKVLSHFITGVLSTTAASPCTVPFMVSAVGFAFSRTYIEIFIIFFFLGLGLSSPYLLLSFFPKALKYVPNPGRRTEIFKKLLSIPLFLTVLWLLSILYSQVDLKVFLFSLILFPLLLAWLFTQKIIKKSIIKKTLTFIAVCLFITFFIGQKIFLKVFKNESNVQNIQKTTTKNLDWLAFNEDQILFDKQKGENILLAFGAKWCLTCQFNERIFNTKEFSDLVKDNKIKLYYGDWTTKTNEITQFLESYGQQGVPFYIFFKGEERLFIFPSLLLKESFLQDLKKYLK